VLIVLPSAVVGVSTYAVYRGTTGGSIDFENGYEGGFIVGFHGSPYDLTPGYRWTTRNSYVRLENLPTPAELLVHVRLSAPRPAGKATPVWFSANGQRVVAAVVGPGVTSHRFRVPLEERSVSLGIHAETYFVAGLGPVGVQVHGVDFRLSQVHSAPFRPVLWMAAAGLALVGGSLAAGRPVRQACCVSMVVSAGFVYLLAQDSVRFQNYSRDVLWITVGAVAICVGLRFLLDQWQWLPRQERAALSAILALGLLTNLTGIFHPLFLSSDAVFQANRLREVLAGNFFATSMTQHEPPFQIPYPVSLYLLAAPWVALGVDAVRTLQVLTVLFQLVTALAVAFLAARFWQDSRAALLAAALYPAIPIFWRAMSAGNLTNLLGVSASVLFLACLLGLWSGSRPALVGVFFFSLVALTSHLSTALMASALWPSWLVALYWKTPSPDRGLSRLALGAVLSSVFLAALYYAGYWELLGTLWVRLAGEAPIGTDAVSPFPRFGARVSLGREQIGSVLLLAVAAGAARIFRRKRKTMLDIVLIVWIAVSAFFLALDVSTPLGVRYLLQATPFLALSSAGFLSWLMRQGEIARGASWLVLLYLLSAALWNLGDCVLVRYH
jgi:hypothetical protein